MSRGSGAVAEAQPARVLHVVSNMDRGGAETMLMNYYRRIDRSVLQFDFLAHSPKEGHFEQEIGSLGGRVFRVASLGAQGPVGYVRSLARLLREEGPFRAVHAHTDSSGALAALAAWLAGVRRRIVHSHNTAARRQQARVTIAVEEAVLKAVIRATATHRCACGRAAAAYLFGEASAGRPGAVITLPNAIDAQPFERAWLADREQLRHALAVPPGAMAIGCVANLVPAKNHHFLLGVAAALKATGQVFTLLLVGDGPLREQLEASAAAAGLSAEVAFLGVRSDVPTLLRALDVFLLPSLFEGLPLAVIEAQAAGLPCLVSDAVTSEVDLGLGLVRRLALEAPMDDWTAALRSAGSTRPPLTFVAAKVALEGRGYEVTRNLGLLDQLYGTGEHVAGATPW